MRKRTCLLLVITALAAGMILGAFLFGMFRQDTILVETQKNQSVSIQAETPEQPSADPSENTPKRGPIVEEVQSAAPTVEETSIAEENGMTQEDSGRVDLNTASAQELETLPGIGPVLAQRIIDYRETNGGFRTTEELLDIKGIGEKTYAKLADYVEVR